MHIRIITNVYCLILFIILLACLNINLTDAALKSANSHEGFESNMDLRIWKIEGNWIPDKNKYFEGLQSLRSDLKYKQNSSLSNKFTIFGPCNISFKWGLSEGHNSFTLYDNGIPTIYKLPNHKSDFTSHNAENENVSFNISDHSEHIFKWVHENPFDEGSAWIDGINITFTIPPRFEELSVNPPNAILVPLPLDGINSIYPITSNFSYSVRSTSQMLKLYIVLPNAGTPLGPFDPTEISELSDGSYKLVWHNTELNCSDIGTGKFWVEADDQFRSIVKDGPSIIALIQSIVVIPHNETWHTFGINMKSSRNWNVAIGCGYEKNKLSWICSPLKYNANSGFKNITYDHFWDAQKPVPKYYEFNLIPI